MKTRYYKLCKALRKYNGFNQSEMARLTGMSRASYISLEKGTKKFYLDEAESFSKATGVTLEELSAGKAIKKEITKVMEVKPN